MKFIKGWLFLLSGLVIALDQISKSWVLHAFEPYHPKAIAPMLNLTLSFNTGAAFSFLSDAGHWHMIFFMVFGTLMTLFVFAWMIRLPKDESLQLTGLSLILGGAIGNLIDRACLGHVVDFIQVYYKTFSWPVFNVADSAICIGAGLLVIDAIRTHYHARRA